MLKVCQNPHNVEKLCYNETCKRKGSDCEAGISFSCMFQRANNSAKQKGELWKSGFASLSNAKEKGATAKQKGELLEAAPGI